MGANSAIQHLSSSLGVVVAGLILYEPPSGPIERFPIVGLMAATVSLSTLWLAGRLRLVALAPANVALGSVQSIVSNADPDEDVLKPAVPPRFVLSREHQRTRISARTG